jgi:hypothetical protein
MAYLCEAMKARLLLIVFLLTQTSLQQLWGAAALVEHYYEHNAGSQKMALVDFLIRHYTEAHEQDGHPEKDHSMPFHHVDGSLQLGYYAPLDQRVRMDHVILTVDQSRFDAHLNQSPCAGETSPIWQPPRI